MPDNHYLTNADYTMMKIREFTQEGRPLFERTVPALISELFKMKTEKMRWYILELRNTGDPTRNTFRLGPNSGRNRTVLFYIERGVFQYNTPPTQLSIGTIKHFSLTMRGEELLAYLRDLSAKGTRIPFLEQDPRRKATPARIVLED